MREQRARFGRREQPASIPVQRRDPALDRAGATARGRRPARVPRSDPSLPAKTRPSPAAGGARHRAFDRPRRLAVVEQQRDELIGPQRDVAWSSSNAGANAGGAGERRAPFDFERKREPAASAARQRSATKNAAATQDMVVRRNSTPL